MGRERKWRTSKLSTIERRRRYLNVPLVTSIWVAPLTESVLDTPKCRRRLEESPQNVLSPVRAHHDLFT